MKWVNLAERQPTSDEYTVLYRATDSKVTIDNIFLRSILSEHHNKVEWLDESAPADWNVQYILPKGAVTADELRIALEKQHKTTLENAVGYIEPFWALTNPDLTHREQIQQILSQVPREI